MKKLIKMIYLTIEFKQKYFLVYLYLQDIFYSGSVYHLPQYKETNNVDDYVASITSIPAMHEETIAPKTITCGCFPRQMADALSG